MLAYRSVLQTCLASPDANRIGVPSPLTPARATLTRDRARAHLAHPGPSHAHPGPSSRSPGSQRSPAFLGRFQVVCGLLVASHQISSVPRASLRRGRGVLSRSYCGPGAPTDSSSTHRATQRPPLRTRGSRGPGAPMDSSPSHPGVSPRLTATCSVSLCLVASPTFFEFRRRYS